MRWTNIEPVTPSEIREKQISYINILYMESRKIVLVSLLAGQQWRQREQSCRHGGEEEGGTNGECSMGTYAS